MAQSVSRLRRIMVDKADALQRAKVRGASSALLAQLAAAAEFAARDLMRAEVAQRAEYIRQRNAK